MDVRERGLIYFSSSLAANARRGWRRVERSGWELSTAKEAARGEMIAI